MLQSGFKTARGRGSVTLPSLGPNIAELQQLSTECGVELASVWQTALALTLHSYNPSEAVVFACQDELSGLDRQRNVYIYTLRIEPTETALGLLRRFNGSKYPSSDQSLDHQISSTRLGDAGPSAASCKVAMRCHSRAGKRSFSDMDQTLDSLFNIAPKHASRLTGCLEYSASEITEGLAWSMLYTVDSVLRNMGMSLRLPVEDLNFCSQYDLNLLQRFTASVAAPEERCIHELILDQCRATPNAIAITSSWGEDHDITYAELDDLTSRIAHHLVLLGVGPEIFVLICLEKSMWAIIARVAVLRAGGAYIMIDARNPPTYLNSIVQRANAKIMLTSPQFTNSPMFQNLLPTIVEISRNLIQALPQYPTPPITNVKSHNACLILFTSGSTGAPKGIIQTHRSYATAIREYAKVLKLGPKSRTLQFDDYAFDISNNDYLAPLLTGGLCCVPRAFSVENPPTITKLIHEINTLQVTTTFLTPTVAVQINPDEVKSLNLVCIGGEPMAKDLLNKWYGKAKLVNQYGMGEVATFCAYNDHPTTEKPATIGRPACNTIWLVSLASPERLVPIGAAGEVLIEGPNIARGYLDSQSRTAGARFLDCVPSWMADLHPERSPSSMYLSGDLARYTHDGTLEYVGRKDLLLKLDGCRVDAVEVEHCARKILDANDAIVIDLLGSITETAQPTLTAYLYLHDHPMAHVKLGGDTVFRYTTTCALASVKVVEIEAALKEVLPYHMIPTNFLLVNQIPKTGSKKTDRKKLHAEGERFWGQESSPTRRIFLITHSRTAVNLLAHALSLKNQPAVMSNESTGYFFLPAADNKWQLTILKRDIQEWSEDERNRMKQAYQASFNNLEKYVNSAAAIGKITFITEDARYLSEPISRSRHLLGQCSAKETPWTLQVPSKYWANTSRSSLNETLLPDNFLKTWTPTFLIRHPALSFPSQYRASLDNTKKSNSEIGPDPILLMHLTLHWTRQLHDFYAEHLRTINSEEDNGVCLPIVIDADDVVTNPGVVNKLCTLVGLDATALAITSQESRDSHGCAIGGTTGNGIVPNGTHRNGTFEENSVPNRTTLNKTTTNGNLRKDDSQINGSTPDAKSPSRDTVKGDPIPNGTITNGTIQNSTHFTSSKLPTINIEDEAMKWRREFGESEAKELEKLVRAAMRDYDYLKARSLRV